MGDERIRVLFLCTGNSARSIMAEAILGRLGADRFLACSAGSTPTGQVNAAAIRELEAHGFETGHFRSKSWDEFAGAGTEPFDIVLTVCDSAAREACPVWPGAPVSAHWGLPDPAAATGTQEAIDEVFAGAYRLIATRIARLVELPVKSLPRDVLLARLRAIGQDSATD